MSSVWAAVVTRNRRELLTECLQALLAQTRPLAGIVVFDNASTDGTEEWLRDQGLLGSPRIRFARSAVNTGGAGGFARALEYGLATGAQWLWLMDDDAEPDPDALERLLSAPVAGDPQTAALCARIVHRDRTIDPLHRCRLRRFIVPLPAAAYRPQTNADVDCASFVGLLVRTEAARTAGLPHQEYFLGYDDAEYSLRLRAHGRIRLVPESVVMHKVVIGGGEITRRCRLWNRLLGTHYTSSPWENYWKDLYRVRNLVALKAEHGGVSGPELLVLILGYAAKTLLYERRALRRIPWLVRFALRGRQRDFRAPSPEQWLTYARS